MLGNLRKRMILGQNQPGIGLVVAQHDVEARLQLLDQVGFQQQRFGFGVGGDDFHRHGFRHHAAQTFRQAADLGVGMDPAFQAARLADVQRVALRIQHAIDPRVGGHGLQRRLDNGHTFFRGHGSILPRPRRIETIP